MAEHHVVAGIDRNHLLHTAERGHARLLGFLRQCPVLGGQYPGAGHVIGKSTTVHGFSWYARRFGVQPRHRESALFYRHAVAERILRGHAWNLERSPAPRGEAREDRQRTAQGVDDRLSLTGDERRDENHLAYPCGAEFGDDAGHRHTGHRVAHDYDVTKIRFLDVGDDGVDPLADGGGREVSWRAPAAR